MDQIEDQKLLDAAKLDKDHILRRTLQVVISASLLTLLFFYYPGILFFPSSLAHTLERKYMFLICNGILAFLAKSSVSHGNSYSDETVLGGKFSAVPNLSETKVAADSVSPIGVSFCDEGGEEQESIEDRDQAVEAADEEHEEQGNDQIYVDNYGDNSEDLISYAENENFDEEGKDRFSSNQEEEGEEEMEATETEEEELTNTDELNKKFEEFIRKMKEELRIQAQQQIITV